MKNYKLDSQNKTLGSRAAVHRQKVDNLWPADARAPSSVSASRGGGGGGGEADAGPWRHEVAARRAAWRHWCPAEDAFFTPLPPPSLLLPPPLNAFLYLSSDRVFLLLSAYLSSRVFFALDRNGRGHFGSWWELSPYFVALPWCFIVLSKGQLLVSPTALWYFNGTIWYFLVCPGTYY